MSNEYIDNLRKKLLGESDELALPENMLNLDELIKSIGIHACKYAREHITGGSTQIENNGYHPDIRHQLKMDMKKLRSEQEELNWNTLSFQLESNLRTFYCCIDNCKKLMRGNCQELAFMALDYVIQHVPYVNAEIYMISGGDHVFLVIGRDPESDQTKPETWGSSAYICDPWAKKTYLASEYLTNLTNFKQRTEDGAEHRTSDGKSTYTNHKTPFDPNAHKLKKLYDCGSNERDALSLRKQLDENKIAFIREQFEQKTYAVIESIELLDSRLEQLKTRYNKNEPKAEIIHRVRDQLKIAVNVFRTPLQDNTYFFPTNLKDNLSKCEQIIKDATDLSADECQQLQKHRFFGQLDKNSFLTKALRSFGIYSKSEKQYKKAVDEAMDAVQILKK